MCDVYLPSASSTESCDTSYSSSREEMVVSSTVQAYEGEPRASNEDFDETDKDSFSPVMFRLRLEQNIPATKCLVCCVFVLFSNAKSSLRMVSCVRCHNILFLRTMRGEGSPWSVL